MPQTFNVDDIRKTQALWYAWGRIDSGARMADNSKPEAYEFARQYRERARAFDMEKRVSMPSIQRAWDCYVNRRPLDIN